VVPAYSSRAMPCLRRIGTTWSTNASSCPGSTFGIRVNPSLAPASNHSVISCAIPSGVPVKSSPPGSADSRSATSRNVVPGCSEAIW
jgi:hypothetical protein